MGIWGMEYTQKENELSFDHFSFVLPYFYTKTRLISSKYNCFEPKTRILTVIKWKIGPLLSCFLYFFVHIFLFSPIPTIRTVTNCSRILHTSLFSHQQPVDILSPLAFHFFLQPNPPKKATTIFICKKEQKSVGSLQHGLFHFLLTSSENESRS